MCVRGAVFAAADEPGRVQGIVPRLWAACRPGKLWAGVLHADV